LNIGAATHILMPRAEPEISVMTDLALPQSLAICILALAKTFLALSLQTAHILEIKALDTW